jgi:hypothetical protein
MTKSFKSAAILHLLELSFYRNVFVINGWQAMNSIIKSHSKNCLYAVESDFKGSCKFKKQPFDLIIAFSPDYEALEFIKDCFIASKTEIIIVHSSHWSYNEKDINRYRRLAGIATRKRRSEVSYKYTLKLFSNASCSVYLPFPNVVEPELILPKGEYMNYRRYWSWSQRLKTRGFYSVLSEYVCIQIFKSSIFSPFTLVKIN